MSNKKIVGLPEILNLVRKNIFCRKKNLGGGTVLDLGIYVIQCCQWVFQQAPKSITATGTLNKDGVDLEMSAELNYGDNKVGNVSTSSIKTLNNTAKIVGTNGEITVCF